MKWYPVRINFKNELGHWYYDEIQGANSEHALNRAYWNWPEADKIELVF